MRLRYFFIFLFLLLNPYYSLCLECIEADDFGQKTTLFISGHFPKGSSAFMDNVGMSSDLEWSSQVVKWKRLGYYTTGDDITLTVEGEWTDWFEGEINMERVCGPFRKKLPPGMCSSRNECAFLDKFSPVEDYLKGHFNVPCWFKNGYGAYVLFKRPGDPDPNDTLEIMRNPVSPMIHIGYESKAEGGDGFFTVKSNGLNDQNCNVIQIEPGWDLYARVTSNFYWDNSGGYTLRFNSGVKKELSESIFEKIRNFVTGLIKDSSKSVFLQITSNNQYINFVRALLLLFVASSALAYLLGLIQQKMSDIFVRLIKFSIIYVFALPDSWEFFYSYVIHFYFVALDHIIAIIASHSGVDYNPDAPFSFMDQIFEIIFSANFWIKLLATTFSSNGLGILFMFLMLFIIIFYIIVLIYSFVLYLNAFVGIAVIVSIMPIIFLAMLFAKTNEIFTNWFKVANSFSIQAIMMFTLISLFSSLLMTTIYKTLGYTVCKNTFFTLGLCLGKLCKTIDVEANLPGQIYDPIKIGNHKFEEETAEDARAQGKDVTSMDARYQFTGGKKFILVPPLYKELDYRYVDLPYYRAFNNVSKVDAFIENIDPLYQDIAKSLVVYEDQESYVIARNATDALEKIGNMGSSKLKDVLTDLVEKGRNLAFSDPEASKKYMVLSYKLLEDYDNNNTEISDANLDLISGYLNQNNTNYTNRSISLMTGNVNGEVYSYLSKIINNGEISHNVRELATDLSNEISQDFSLNVPEILRRLVAIKEELLLMNGYQVRSETLYATRVLLKKVNDVNNKIQFAYSSGNANQSSAGGKTEAQKITDLFKELGYSFNNVESVFLSSAESALEELDEENLTQDQQDLKKILETGNFVLIENLFMMLVMVFLLWNMITFVQKIGALIAGGSPFLNILGVSLANLFGPDQKTLFGKLSSKVGELFSLPATLYRQKIGSAIANATDKVVHAPRSIPALGLLFDAAYVTTGIESDMRSELKTNYRLRGIEYARTMVGYHIGLVTDTIKSGGMNLAKDYIKHNWDTLGQKDPGYLKAKYLRYKLTKQNIHDDILGYSPRKPTKVKQEPDNIQENPFSPYDPNADGRTRRDQSGLSDDLDFDPRNLGGARVPEDDKFIGKEFPDDMKRDINYIQNPLFDEVHLDRNIVDDRFADELSLQQDNNAENPAQSVDDPGTGNVVDHMESEDIRLGGTPTDDMVRREEGIGEGPQIEDFNRDDISEVGTIEEDTISFSEAEDARLGDAPTEDPVRREEGIGEGPQIEDFNRDDISEAGTIEEDTISFSEAEDARLGDAPTEDPVRREEGIGEGPQIEDFNRDDISEAGTIEEDTISFSEAEDARLGDAPTDDTLRREDGFDKDIQIEESLSSYDSDESDTYYVSDQAPNDSQDENISENSIAREDGFEAPQVEDPSSDDNISGTAEDFDQEEVSSSYDGVNDSDEESDTYYVSDQAPNDSQDENISENSIAREDGFEVPQVEDPSIDDNISGTAEDVDQEEVSSSYDGDDEADAGDDIQNPSFNADLGNVEDFDQEENSSSYDGVNDSDEESDTYYVSDQAPNDSQDENISENSIARDDSVGEADTGDYIQNPSFNADLGNIEDFDQETSSSYDGVNDSDEESDTYYVSDQVPDDAKDKHIPENSIVREDGFEAPPIEDLNSDDNISGNVEDVDQEENSSSYDGVDDSDEESDFYYVSDQVPDDAKDKHIPENSIVREDGFEAPPIEDLNSDDNISGNVEDVDQETSSSYDGDDEADAGDDIQNPSFNADLGNIEDFDQEENSSSYDGVNDSDEESDFYYVSDQVPDDAKDKHIPENSIVREDGFEVPQVEDPSIDDNISGTAEDFDQETSSSYDGDDEADAGDDIQNPSFNADLGNVEDFDQEEISSSYDGVNDSDEESDTYYVSDQVPDDAQDKHIPENSIVREDGFEVPQVEDPSIDDNISGTAEDVDQEEVSSSYDGDDEADAGDDIQNPSFNADLGNIEDFDQEEVSSSYDGVNDSDENQILIMFLIKFLMMLRINIFQKIV